MQGLIILELKKQLEELEEMHLVLADRVKIIIVMHRHNQEM